MVSQSRPEIGARADTSGLVQYIVRQNIRVVDATTGFAKTWLQSVVEEILEQGLLGLLPNMTQLVEDRRSCFVWKKGGPLFPPREAIPPSSAHDLIPSYRF